MQESASLYVADSPVAAWPPLGEPPTIGARSGGGGDSLAVQLVQGVLDKSHRLILDLAGRVPNLVPRMDAQECLKRTVCEAHNKPGRYGLLGITLQFFFPYVHAPPLQTTLAAAAVTFTMSTHWLRTPVAAAESYSRQRRVLESSLRI